MSSKKLNLIDKQNVWHPFTQMSEWEVQDTIMIEKARGNYLIDSNGKKYFDGVASMWVNVHGHNRREINQAIKKQIDKVSHSTLLGLANVPSTILSEKLLKLLPTHFKKVFYSDDGSTAVEVALKMAFQYHQSKNKPEPKRKKFLAFTNAYHGDTVGGMSVGEIDVFVETFKPLLFKSFRAEYPNCYRCPVNKTYPSCKLACLKSFEDILAGHHTEIAACIVEPMMEGAFGMVPMPPDYLSKMAKLCKKHDILLIFDEVATGFGRTGKMFALDHLNKTIGKTKPDIICIAKGLTGGYLPLAATVTTKKIYDAFLGRFDEFKAFFHGHTYTGNQLGSAAAIASIEIFKKDKTLTKGKKKSKLIESELSKLSDLPHVGDIRGMGFMWGVEIVKNKTTKKPFATKDRIGYKICLESRKAGLFIRPLGDVITFIPPLTVTEKEIVKYIKIIKNSIEEVTGK